MESLPGDCERQMWHDFDMDRSDTSLLDADWTLQRDPMEQREAEFNKALDRAEMNFDPTSWDYEEFDITRDVDETLTNIMEDLGLLQSVNLLDGVTNSTTRS